MLGNGANRNSLQYRERAEGRFYVILCNSRTALHRKFNFAPFCSPEQPAFKKYLKINVLRTAHGPAIS